MDGSQDFAATRLSFEATGEGVAVDAATGRLSIDTGKLRDGVLVTVTATNALGSTVGRLSLSLATEPETGTGTAPTVVAPLADVAADAGAAPVTVAAAAAFAGSALTFAVSGRGAVIDSVTGLVTIATDELLDSERITVTATNSGGSAETSFLASVRATLPVCARQPALAGGAGSSARSSGTAVVGTGAELDPGDWDGVPAPELAIAWLLDGVVVEGATGTRYTPAAADDGRGLSARVTATNAAGTAAAETAALAVVHAAPTVVAPLADVSLVEGAAAVVVEAAAAFAGAGLAFAVAGGGATVDAAGRVSVPATAVGSATVTVTATNSGGSAEVAFTATVAASLVLPLLLAAPVLAGTGRIGAPVTVSGALWSGVPAPVESIAWLRDGAAISGATAASYTPVAADDGKALSARVTATNLAGRAETVTASLAVTYAPPVAKGALVEEVFDLGSGVQTVAAGADFTGDNLAFAVTGAGATIDARTGLVSIPTDAAVQATVTVTATNSGGSATSRFRVTVEAEDIPFALEVEDVSIVTSVWRPDAQATWLTPVVSFPGLAGETVDAIEWTTSAKDPIPEAEFEVVTPVGKDGYQLYMRDAAKNVPGATPRVDYSVFRLDETKRIEALRFRWRRTAEGSWSALSPAFAVPAPSVASWKKRWIPLITRAKAGYEAKILDGPGKQFLRSFATTAANPNLLLAVMDQNFQWESDDFGGTFFTPSWRGQFAGRQGVSCWIDPGDAGRQLMFYAINPSGASTAENASTGIYLSTDGGKTCTQVLSTPYVRGTNTVRHNYQVICHKPGGTPAARTVFALVTKSTASSAAAASIQLHRSTDGGATWAARGGALATGTYANGNYGPYEIAFNPAGTLMHMCGPTGIWWSEDEGTSWTKCTGIPSGAIHHIQYQNDGTCWIGTNAGLYKAANGKAFAKVASFGDVNAAGSAVTASGSPQVLAFAISPADSNYIVAAQQGFMHPVYSTNGGTSWSVGESHERIGQEEAKAHSVGSNDHYGIVAKPGDREVFFFHLGQHYGVSTDHGQNIHQAGMLFEGTHTRGDIGFHPSDWTNFAMVQQDRACTVTQTAGDYWLEDDIGDKTAGPGLKIVTAVGDSTYISGAGALMHASGRIVCHCGQATGKRVAVIIDQNAGSLANAYVTSCVSGLTDQCRLDPNNANRGFGGQYRITDLDASSPGGVTFTQMARQFVSLTGYGGATVLYGCNKADGSNRDIYRSASATPGDSWALWKTTARSFRPVDQRPAFFACPHHAARVYAVSGDGYVVRIEGASNPTETTIFDARDYISGAPSYQAHTVVVDPFDPNLGYVSLYMWGCPNVFRTTNLLSATPTWESLATGDEDGLPHLDLELSIHPLTSDVLACGSHGTYVCKPPAAHQETYGLKFSLWDRIATYVASTQ